MAQHFLLSAQARTLSLKSIYRMSEDQAYKVFCNIRWHETDGVPVCPRCGCIESYDITTRRKYKCKACHHQFSVTSSSIFASRKMNFIDLLAAICNFINAFETGSEARDGIGRWMGYYNRRRPHSSLGRHRTPDECYAMQWETEKLAA